MNTHKKIRKLCHCSVSALETVIDCVSKEKQIAVWIHRGSCFLFPLYLNIFIWDKTNLALKNMKGFCIEKREGRLFLEERTFLHKGERILKEWLKVSVTAPPPPPPGYVKGFVASNYEKSNPRPNGGGFLYLLSILRLPKNWKIYLSFGLIEGILKEKIFYLLS